MVCLRNICINTLHKGDNDDDNNNNKNNNNNHHNNNNKIQHILAACEQLAPTKYVKRHDGLAKVIHQKLAEAAGLIVDKAYTISICQPVYWRTIISSCTGTAAHLWIKQYLLTDLT